MVERVRILLAVATLVGATCGGRPTLSPTPSPTPTPIARPTQNPSAVGLVTDFLPRGLFLGVAHRDMIFATCSG